jgi:hypothetical protein
MRRLALWRDSKTLRARLSRRGPHALLAAWLFVAFVSTMTMSRDKDAVRFEQKTRPILAGQLPWVDVEVEYPTRLACFRSFSRPGS